MQNLTKCINSIKYAYDNKNYNKNMALFCEKFIYEHNFWLDYIYEYMKKSYEEFDIDTDFTLEVVDSMNYYYDNEFTNKLYVKYHNLYSKYDYGFVQALNKIGDGSQLLSKYLIKEEIDKKELGSLYVAKNIINNEYVNLIKLEKGLLICYERYLNKNNIPFDSLDDYILISKGNRIYDDKLNYEGFLHVIKSVVVLEDLLMENGYMLIEIDYKLIDTINNFVLPKNIYKAKKIPNYNIETKAAYEKYVIESFEYFVRNLIEIYFANDESDNIKLFKSAIFENKSYTLFDILDKINFLIRRAGKANDKSNII